MKTKVSGVPYEVELEVNFSTISEAVSYYEGIIATLEQENKLMRARMTRLEEECHWLEHQSRASKDDLK
jgi:hypothetical protein